ncbi:MAG: FAD-dependent oxidoreductase [Rhodoluna sp.]|nr:FAD-dependent oxidoreductase [Rhodoluna sp.]MBP6186883.1 FAD-dependent oxidoreductase [Rhodoluna sp.]
MGALRTAEALRRFGYHGPITAIGDEPYAPYNRPPLSKEVLAKEVSHEAVAFAQRAATEDVNWVLGTKVVSADLEHSKVTDSDGVTHAYSALIAATGLRPKRLQVPNGELAGRHAVRTLDDAIGLRAALTPGANVVILGAGFIGCEVAATARKLGCEVTVVAPGVHPIVRPLGVELAKEIQRRHEAEGVRFIMKTTIDDLIGESHITGVVLDSGEELACDVLVEAIGSHANTEWLEGCDVDIADGILTDNAMRAVRLDGSAHENFFAIGDVARFANPLFDDVARRVEHWNIPTDTGKRVGQVLAAMLNQAENWPAVLEEKFAPIPSFWSDQFEMHILAFGLLALADEVRLIHGEIDGDCVFGYYRGGQMVGVCGIGLRSTVQGYRAQVGNQ